MINNISELVARLKDEAESLEGLGASELACGVLAAIRVINDELSPYDQIGGEASEQAEPLDTAELDAVKGELEAMATAHGSLSVKHERLMKSVGAIEANRHLAADYGGRLALGFNGYKVLQSDVNAAEQGISHLLRCKACRGGGKVRPMFYVYDCDVCGGSGCNIKAKGVIVAQQTLIRTQKTMITKLLHEIFMRALSQKEKEAISIEAFYEDSKTNVRCD